MTTDLKDLAAAAALNDMMANGWMDICTIRSVAEMLGRHPRGDTFEILRSLHCINFDKMPKELRDEIPRLIEQCLNCAPIRDRRPAMNDGLREAYAEWSGEVYAMGARAAVGEEERDEKNARKATGLTDD